MGLWVVTGGIAGFIGSNLLSKLNEEGLSDLLVVDLLETSEKWKNLRGKRFADYLEAGAFKEKLLANRLPKIDGIVHMGACSSTTETNASYLIDNNYEYTKAPRSMGADVRKPDSFMRRARRPMVTGGFGYTTDVSTTAEKAAATQHVRLFQTSYSISGRSRQGDVEEADRHQIF